MGAGAAPASPLPPGRLARWLEPWRARWLTRWFTPWLSWRNARIASPAFQRWAAGFPLTRRVARAETRALFDLCAGFVYAQVLFACVQLDLFRILAAGPQGADGLARRLALPPERALVLLRAAASLRLLRALPDGRFALADLGAALLGNPGVARMIEHHALLYADLADPVALLRNPGGPTRLAGYWPYAAESAGASESAGHAALPSGTALEPEAVAPYGGLMAASQALIAEDVLEAYPFRRHRRLLDVGGGEGAFLAAVAPHAPGLRLGLFDLPAVAARAAARLEEAGLGHRAACHGGSFHRDPLPRGADLVTLVRVLHDHDDGPALALLRRIHDALPPGGTLLVAEPMAGTRGAEPVGDAYFGLYLLAMGSGRPRRADEIQALLRAAGFRAIAERRTRRPLLVRLIRARRA
ncbi:acetylserotonin O-methyltransferase [Methylobacterium gregans]|uniref:Demethylspheroidene O-methyltransferase n=1 Tax=Methylobacterium gregans TaxID=374424 RepID=A0AA37MHX4_9HYPH|nr:acetylserotonin O-methyltransferase [Methylobacterium gregans]MDQ0521207.1 demethylspheroidene O-methyltransferase [Methylobacterium gregans]GJD81586.1 Demethylspheroidene O-methyltransferase [Methylobacterium gregans]GLS54373.1 O-methyltransferase [Methylobacterium gregans]